MRGAVRLLTGVALAGVLAGCLGGPPEGPAWKRQAADAMERYYHAMLVGDSARAGSSLRRALEAGSRSSDLTTLARVHLGRAAMRRALRRPVKLARADELIGLTGSPALAAYRRYLTGDLTPEDPERLPATLQPVARALLTGDQEALAEAVSGLADPRRRLVAAAVAHRRQADPALADVAVAAATEPGWRAALLTWLPLQAEAAAEAGDTERAEAIRARIRWLRHPTDGNDDKATAETGTGVEEEARQ